MGKKDYIPKSKEEIKQELDGLIDKSLDRINKYCESPEDMLEFADFMSKIHNYSATNLALIDAQFSGAQAVASYSDWQKHGFQVKKGEKGIKIYAYTPYVVFEDENGERKQLKEATPKQKEKVKKGQLKSAKISSFKTGHVFDVSQTNANPEDLPKIFPNKVWNFNLEGENSIEQLEKGVDALANSLNININDMKKSGLGELGVTRGAYVQYVDGKEEIILNSRNSRTQNVATSIHELAHKKLHNLDRIKGLPEAQKELGITNTEIKEFQAEMTSYIVCKNYGMDTSEKAIPYIAKWTKNGTEIHPRLTRDILTDVKNTASEFIDTIDKTIISERERQQELDPLKENNIKEIEVNKQQEQQPKMAQKNSFEPDQFKEDKEVIKDFIEKSFNQEKDTKLPFYEQNKDRRTVLGVGTYYIDMFEYYKDKYPDFKYNLDSEIVTMKIGQNKINYHTDINEIEILDIYKVTKDNIAINNNDWKVIASTRNEDTRMYVERFINESINKHELKLSQENDIDINDIKIIGYDLNEIMLGECIYNLSDEAETYYDKDKWKEEIENQLNYNSITDLDSCEDPKEFYQDHKEEIEQTLDDLSSYGRKDIRQTIEMSNYEDIASLIAYKTALTTFQNGIDNFTIPDHAILEKPVEKEFNDRNLLTSHSQEMEIG